MFTFGCDPESFFTEGGLVLPAKAVFTKLLGEAALRYTVGQAGDLYVDGAAVEFQPTASTDYEEVIDNLALLLRTAGIWGDEYGTQVVIAPELGIDLDWCKRDPGVAIFGCDPDQSAWGEGCRPATIDAAKHPFRYAGCHLHFGFPGRGLYFLVDNNIQVASRALDRTIGLASMALGANEDTRRREIYGRPGVYRVQPWGMEYRTPSNVLLRSPGLMRFAFEVSRKTLNLVVKRKQIKLLENLIPDDLVVATLRGDDITLAGELYHRVANIFDLPTLPSTQGVTGENWREQWR